MKGVHERARSKRPAASLLIIQCIQFLHAELQRLLYSRIALLSGITVPLRRYTQALPPQHEDGTPVRACLPQGSVLSAWRSTALMTADSNCTSGAYDAGSGWQCSCQTATGLDAAAALRSPAIRSCSPPTLNIPARKYGSRSRGEGHLRTAGPRKASMNTAMPFVYAIRITCSGSGRECCAWFGSRRRLCH